MSYLFQKHFIIIILAIIIPAHQLNWQGTGTMTESNMTEIQNTINNNPLSTSLANYQIDAVAKTISTHLNDIWDPAWNVFIIRQNSTYDSVLYGYAFRNHWMWINGIPFVTAFSNSLAYIIWKDYNCERWKIKSDITFVTSTLTTAQISQINAKSLTGLLADVWLAAYNLIEFINIQSTLSSGAYSVVMSQYRSASFCGYICLVYNNYLQKIQV